MQWIYEAVRKSVYEGRENMQALLKRIVDIDSGSRNIRGVEEVCGVLKQGMEDTGMTVRVIPSDGAGPVLTGEQCMDVSRRLLPLIGHMDTVFKDGTAEIDPFKIGKEGPAHDPDVLDMKAGPAVALYTARALRDVGYEKRPIKCTFMRDKENPHMFSNVKNIMLLEPGGAEAAFDFETGYVDDGLVAGGNGDGIIDIVIESVLVHSETSPEKGRSAVIEMTYRIVEIESKRDLKRDKLTDCGMVSGGVGENTVPEEAKISVGTRFPTTAIRGEILEGIKSAAAHIYIADTIAKMQARMLMGCMEATGGMKKLLKHINNTVVGCGYGDFHTLSVGGISDPSICASNGMSTVCVMGVGREGNHTVNEYVIADGLFEKTVLADCTAYTL